MTILKVEPLAQGATYKYVKAYFSSALDSLDPMDIEIRGKKDKKLYSVQTAVLSADGMSADLTLYGTQDADGTTFLRANTTYVMTLTQDGVSTSLEFELPAYMTDKIVTSVDTTNNKITVASSFRTGETGTLWEDADFDSTYDLGEEYTVDFNLAGKYAGNLGTLIGRMVNFQYDTDLNLTDFDVEDQEVVYGAMQYVNDGGNLKDGYYKDKLTGTKYKNSANSSSTKNVTRVYNAYDGTLIGNEPAVLDAYNYAKLVLNPDGTVSTAFVLATLPINLFVTEVDGTKAIQDGDNGVDLDGYIIVKDDEYIAPADLELGDVVFINATNKFADVYNNTVSGTVSNVISGKLDLDDKTYDWNGAQYYDPVDDKYKTLSTTDDDEGAQNYLNSLDPEEDTTLWLSRTGKIKYLAGEETGVVETTDVTYLITDDAKGYTESLKPMLQIKVFDGSDKDTLGIPISELKYYNGVAGSYEADMAWTGIAGDTFTFTGKTDDSEDVAGENIAVTFPAGELMVVTYDATGKAIGLKSHQSADLIVGAGDATDGTIDNTTGLQEAGSPNLTKDTSIVTTKIGAAGTDKFSTGSYTNLWIINQNDKTNDAAAPNNVDKDDTYSMTVLTDFTNEILTADAADTNGTARFVGMAIRTNGTKATDLVVTILNDNAYKAAETNTIYGMLTDVTKKNNSDNNTQVINTIKIIGTDGVTATYYGDGSLAAVAGAATGDYVALTQNKSTTLITAAAAVEDWDYSSNPTDYLAASRDYSSSKLVLADGTELTVKAGGAILLRYTEEGSTKHKVVTYSDVNTIKKAMGVWFNETYVDETGTKVQSDMIVVQEVGAEDALGSALDNFTLAANNLSANTDPTKNADLKAIADAAQLVALGAIADWEAEDPDNNVFDFVTPTTTAEQDYDAAATKVGAYETAEAALADLTGADITPASLAVADAGTLAGLEGQIEATLTAAPIAYDVVDASGATLTMAAAAPAVGDTWTGSVIVACDGYAVEIDIPGTGWELE